MLNNNNNVFVVYLLPPPRILLYSNGITISSIFAREPTFIPSLFNNVSLFLYCSSYLKILYIATSLVYLFPSFNIWAIVNNTVVYSGGPDTTVGSGNEAFPPINSFPYPSTPIKLVPVTVQNGGLLVFTDAGIYIILGIGTPDNPFYTTIYYGSVNLLGYDALDVYNTEIFLMEAT